MRMDNRCCSDTCAPKRIVVSWESYDVPVKKIMINDFHASAFVDQLHSNEIDYSVKFL